jgi:hypothetical protein
MVGEEGLEPSRACAHKILSLACIPISPLARELMHKHLLSLQGVIVLYLNILEPDY